MKFERKDESGSQQFVYEESEYSQNDNDGYKKVRRELVYFEKKLARSKSVDPFHFLERPID